MEKIIIITFPDAKNATGGLNRLRDLDRLGDITIYSYALINKTGDNQFHLHEHEGAYTSGLPAIGAISGAIIGLIGGPVGMTIGMLSGGMLGAVDEGDDLDMADEVLDRVKNSLSVGDFAVVLDVEEDDDILVNSYIEPLQGVIVRTEIAEQYDRYDDEQWKELNREIDEDEQALKAADDKNKASIKAKIEKLKKKRNEKFQKMKEKSAKRKKMLQDRLKSFDDKIKTSKENTRDRLRAHREKLEAKLESINEKLDRAFA